jgi:hypothetical protein
MRKVIFLIAVVTVISCESDEKSGASLADIEELNSVKIPSCIGALIDSFKSMPPQNPEAQIYKVLYKNTVHYYVPPFCCDQYSTLYDETCKVICHPDGGITGQGDGQCKKEDFLGEPVLIWRDERD